MPDIAAVSSSTTNLTTGAPTTESAAVSNSTTTMSFDDFIDMINPLQHIPLVSSLYRAVEGETINPISRIAGDTLYGGILGLASAGIAALGAVADEVVAANNGGKSISQTVVGALFGDDAAKAGDTSDTQLASSQAPTATTTASVQSPAFDQVAMLQTPARQTPILAYPDLSAPATLAAPTAPTSTQVATAHSDAASLPLPIADTNGIALPTPNSKGIPIDRSKLAYGGVMDNAMVQSAQQNQALALAMTSGVNAMQLQHGIRNSRFAVGAAMPGASTPTPTVPLPTQDPSKTAAAIATQIVPNPGAPPDRGPVLTQPALQNLMQQLQGMKGINQYRNAAQSLPLPGAMLNTAN